MNEPALIALGLLAFAAWTYYQDVYVQKLEGGSSLAPFYLLAAVVSYPLLALVLAYIRTHCCNEKVQTLVLALIALGWTGIVMVLVSRKNRRRRVTLENVARQLGLNFDPAGSIPLPGDLIQIPTFDSVGEGVSNVLREERPDHECAIFDHRYSLREESEVAHTIAAYRISSVVPEFKLKPDNALDKLVAAFGGTDVDFPNDPRFSSTYRLVCSDQDEVVIREMFSRDLCSLFEREEGWTIGGKGNWVGMYKHRILVAPHNLSAF